MLFLSLAGFVGSFKGEEDSYSSADEVKAKASQKVILNDRKRYGLVG